MRSHSIKLAQIGLMLVFLTGVIGCVTTSDLDQLREELRKEVESEAAVTRDILSENATQREQALAKFEALHERLTRQVQGVQEAVQPIADLPSTLVGLTQQLRSIQQAMLGNYQIEETVLRERLRGIEHAITLLRPALSGEGIQTSSPGGEPGGQ